MATSVTSVTSGSARCWDLTVNNFRESDVDLLKSWAPDVKKMVVAHEVGECGTPHLQGRIWFARTYRFPALKKMSPASWHWEVTRAAQDSLYCRKHDSVSIVDVDNRQQGSRTDIAAAVQTMRERGIHAVAEEHPVAFVKYCRGLRELDAELREVPPDLEQLDNWWFYGPPRTGKSSTARRLYGESLYVKMANKWWDGYCGEATVLIEDLAPLDAAALCAQLKLWSDRYRTRVESKGSSLVVRPTRIVVTSNYSMASCFDGVDLAALQSRFTEKLFSRDV